MEESPWAISGKMKIHHTKESFDKIICTSLKVGGNCHLG